VWRAALTLRFLAGVVDKLDPIDAVRQESLWWSVECSTVVFSWIPTFGQRISSVASEGYCISCGKPFRADILGRCLIWLRQNLSFVIIPLNLPSGACEQQPVMISSTAKSELPVLSQADTFLLLALSHKQTPYPCYFPFPSSPRPSWIWSKASSKVRMNPK
jgi:hypothetical protein